MASFAKFESVFGSQPDVPYTSKAIDNIKRNRKHLENELFFDKLLRVLGINQALPLYPAQSNKMLRSLYDQIITSGSSDHHKYSLIYYILKDLKLHSNMAGVFATTAHLPSKYQTFIDGIWFLDRMEFEKALEYLTEPALVPTLPEEILYTLCSHCKDDPSLPLSYYHTVLPSIRPSQRVLDAIFRVLCHATLTEAFYTSRTYEGPMRRHAFEQLLSFVHGSSGGNIRAARAVELLNLPFDEEEAKWAGYYFIKGEGRGLFGAKDTVIMHHITMGRMGNAASLSGKVKDRKIDGLDWESLTRDLQKV